ncbi:hypothetical protein ACFWIB_14435 [Streptomyces sp. NPDC127051]|uniref:hypothetical protein n=1 Tax=Streptomyces sp. NPDC127051 TaxID=3347119 RepID=UPI00365A5DF2
MTCRPVTSFVVDCDVCLRSLETGDLVALFATTAEADEQADAGDWTKTATGHVCPREDVSHRLARHQAT